MLKEKVNDFTIQKAFNSTQECSKILENYGSIVEFEFERLQSQHPKFSFDRPFAFLVLNFSKPRL